MHRAAAAAATCCCCLLITAACQVSIDANGLLKVTHMVPLAGGRGGSSGQQQQQASMQPSALSGFAATQVSCGAQPLRLLSKQGCRVEGLPPNFIWYAYPRGGSEQQPARKVVGLEGFAKLTP
jgi:hypothetical protein